MAEIGIGAGAGLAIGLILTGALWLVSAGLDLVGLRASGPRGAFLRDHPWQMGVTIGGVVAAIIVGPILLRLAGEIGWRGIMPTGLGSAVRKTWRGPFDAAPLVHPITVGDALLKLLQTIWRIALVLIFAAIVLIAGVWLSVQMKPPPLGDQITASARVDPKACTTAQRLLVTFLNGSSRTVQDIAFDFVAHQAGRSRNLVARPQYLHSDAIIAPGRTASLCWAMPELDAPQPGAAIRYGVDISYASESPVS